MKNTIRNTFLSACFTASLALGAKAQLPSEKILPFVLSKEVTQRMTQQPSHTPSASLPSEAKNLPQGIVKKAVIIPNSNNTPIPSAVDRQKTLPSSAKDPITTVKRKRGNG